MSRFSSRNQADDEAAIDLTPMLDVVFIMLIFFIVTASFVKESGLEISRPEQQEQQTESESKNILISITASNEIWHDGRRIDIRSVRANVERLRAENPEASMIIQAHPKADAKTYTSVADQSREAGVYSVSLTLQDQ